MAAAPPGRQVLSLAQGIVHWGPPPAATEAATRLLAAGGPTVHGYGPVEGLPDLRDALAAKLIQRNGLHGVRQEGGRGVVWACGLLFGKGVGGFEEFGGRRGGVKI